MLSIRLAICLCFRFGLAVTLPPLLVGHSSTSLCLPLPSSSSSSSLGFTVSVVLLDSLCFLLMMVAYTRLYCRTNKVLPATEEEVLTRHVARLLFSDCLLSLSALLCLSATGPEAVKGMLLLMAPLPACVNPLLYILCNPLARHKLASLTKHAGVGVCKLTAGGGGGAGGRARGKAMYSSYNEETEKQSYDSTQVLVAVELRKKEEDGGRQEVQWRLLFPIISHSKV